MTSSFASRSRALFSLNLVLLAATAGGTFLLVRPAQTQNDPTSDLVIYRAALDQIAVGKPKVARLLLENSGQTRLAPENATLLAYLQEKDGEAGVARTTLDKVTTPTGVTLAYQRRLATVPRVTVREEADSPGTGFVPVAATTARLANSDARITRLEESMFRMVNAERQRAGLGDLAFDTRMAEVARAHSAEMRDKKYFAHESPTASLKDPMDRYMAGVGARPRMVAENVYRAWGSNSSLNDEGIAKAHTALMNSPGHRANILEAGATRIGIGLATDATGNIWVTQLFARPQ